MQKWERDFFSSKIKQGMALRPYRWTMRPHKRRTVIARLRKIAYWETRFERQRRLRNRYWRKNQERLL